MKARFVKDSINEEHEELVRPEITDYDLVDDEELIVQNDFETKINNELEAPEFAREVITFRTKGGDEIIDAVPMAKLNNGSYLMKVDGKYRKFNINDIIEE